MTADVDPPVEPAKAIDLEEFLRVIPFLESSDLMALSAAYRQADLDAREGWRQAASVAAKQRGLMDELGRLQGSIIQWAGSDMPMSHSLFALAGHRPDQLLSELRMEAVPPLLDAATALLLGDALDAPVREALLEPWSSAIG